MRGKHRGYLDDEGAEIAHHQPLKSPSPDKKSANVIVSTRSPELADIKRQITPSKDSAIIARLLQRIDQKERAVATPPPYREAEGTGTKRGWSKLDSTGQSRAQVRVQVETVAGQFGQSIRREGQLDYLRLLREKEETIRELHQIIEMINRNNVSWTDSQGGGSGSRNQGGLAEQVRVLTIQNQKLINVIEHNHLNIASNMQQILQREIRQLRDSLQEKQSQLQQQRSQVRQLESQNQRLIKLLRQNQKSSNGIPVKNPLDREKLTLVKIRQQYQENLKLMQENFYSEVKSKYQAYKEDIQQANRRVDAMETKVARLQGMKNRAGREAAEGAHREKDRHRQIESLILERSSKYEEALSEQRRANQILSSELSRVQRNLEQLQSRPNTLEDVRDYQAELRQVQQQSQRQRVTFTEVQERRRRDIQELQQKLQALAAEQEEKEAAREARVSERIALESEQHLKREHKLVSQLRNVQGELERSRKQQQRGRRQQEESKNEMEKKVLQLVESYERQIEVLRGTLNAKQAEVAKFIEQQHHLNQEVDYLRRKLAEAGSQSASQEEIESLRNRLVAEESLKEEIMQAKKRLESELHDSQQRVERQSHEATIYLGRLSHLEAEVDRLKAEVFSLEGQCDQLQSKLDQKASLLRDSQFRNQQLRYAQEAKNAALERLERQTGELRARLAEVKGQNYRVAKRRVIWEESLEEELRELRRALGESGNRRWRVEGEIAEDYLRTLDALERSLEQNVRVSGELETLRDDLVKERQERALMSEKVGFLESNIAIYEQQLKERKQLYDKVAHEKSRMERDALLEKRIRNEQTLVEDQGRSNAEQLQGRVDRLLQRERERMRRMRVFNEEQYPQNFQTVISPSQNLSP